MRVGPFSRVTKVYGERRFRAGYVIRDEDIETLWATYRVKRAHTPAGDYIGPSWLAYRLCKVRGIAPEKIDPEHDSCTIGFCGKEQKWYGWSHRAIHGFGIGDVVKEGDACAESGWSDEYLEEYPEKDRSLPVGFRAETLEDAKRMAIAFAESLS